VRGEAVGVAEQVAAEQRRATPTSASDNCDTGRHMISTTVAGRALLLRRKESEQMATGYVGILSFELHFAGSRSLKDKRMHIRSLKQHLVNRVGCSIAEVDHHDTWQRTRLTLACATRTAADADRLLDEAERYVIGQGHDLIARERTLVSIDD